MLTRELILRTFTQIPRMETKRLILRQILPCDVEDMYDYARTKEVTEHLLWNPHPTVQYTSRYVEYLQERYRAGDFYDWAIVLKDNHCMIGTCGFTSFDYTNNSAEVGYVIHPKEWGKGIATEALTAVLQFANNKLHLHRVEARYLEKNIASRHVMEKCGMHFEGIRYESLIVKGHYQNVGVCSIILPNKNCSIEF